MAIKVQGTTVIDDARHISNIGVATVGILSANQITTDGSTNATGVGVANYVLTSGGTSGDISWQPVTAVGSGTLDGINILEEGSIVGTAGSVININFVGNNVTATGVALATTATITISDDPTYNSLNVTGDVGIGITNPTYKLHIETTNADGIFIDDTSTSSDAPHIRVRGKRSDNNGSQAFSGQLILEKNQTNGPTTSGRHLGAIIFGGNYHASPGITTGMTYGASMSAISEGNFSDINTAPTALVFYTGTVGLGTLGTANTTFGDTESLRINSSNNVLIGSSSDTGTTSQKLQVTGGGYISGDVGIGLTAPTAKLEIPFNGSTASQTLRLGGTDNLNGDYIYAIGFGNPNNTQMGIGPHGTNRSIWGREGITHHIHSDDEWTIKSSGWDNIFGVKGAGDVYVKNNLGIGVTDPSKKLEVNGEVKLNLSTTYGDEGILTFGRQDGVTREHFIRVFNTGTASGNYMKFDVHDGTVGSGGLADATTVMTLQGDGKVGIGTENPTEELDVYKTSNDVNIRARTTTAGAYFNAESGDSDYYGLRLYRGSTENWFIGAYGSANLQIKDGAANGGTEVFTIENGTGYVGIGTDNPTAKLDVNGDVAIASTVSIGTTINIVPYNDLGALSFEGSAGQLFSITNNLSSGSIFSVNDISGIPSIDVDADGTVLIAPYGSTEYVGIGTTNPTAKLDINGTLNVTGVSTFQGNVDLGDNDKLRLGDGNDLQIYHSGSENYIDDAGVGSLLIRTLGNNNISLQNSTGNMLNAVGSSGAVELYYGNSKKFETTADGIKVHPNVGLGTVAGNSQDLASFETTNSNGSKLRIVEERDVNGTDWNSAYTRIQKTIDVTDQAYIQFNGNGLTYGMEFGTQGNEKFAVFKKDNAVELYYDNDKKFETTSYGIYVTGAGNTSTIAGAANLVLDPSAVGDNTGTVTILGNLQVDGTQTVINSTVMTVDDLNVVVASGATNASAANGAGLTVDGASATLTYFSTPDSWEFNKDLILDTTDATLKIKAGGTGTRGAVDFTFNTDSTVYGSLELDYDQRASEGLWLNTGSYPVTIESASNQYIKFRSGTTEHMRITSGGNVGIGTDNPSDLLNVYTTGQAKVRIEGDGSATTAASLILQDNDSGSNFRGQGVFYYDSISDVEWFSGRPYSGSDAFSIHRKTSVTDPGDTTANKDNLLFIIDSAGDVGIGTDNPSHRLHVYGSEVAAFGPGATHGNTLLIGADIPTSTDADTAHIELTNGNLHIDTTEGSYGIYLNYFGGQGGTVFGNGNSGGVGKFHHDGILTVNATSVTGTASQNLQVSGGAYVSGSLGIGITNPSTKLDVSGIGRFTNNGGSLQLVGTNHTYLEFYPDGYAAGRKGYFGYPASTTDDLTLANQISGANIELITNSGNVLVNTASETGTASQSLQVSGGAYVSGSFGIGSTNPVGLTPGSSDTLHLNGTSAVIRVGPYYSSGGDRDNILLVANSQNTYIRSNNERFSFYNDSGDILFHGTSDAENVRFTAAGNVGIGTTNPGSTLAVGGTITELYNGSYWNVVTQADVGYGASQVPLNQYLGQLAFLDDYHPNGLRRDGGGSDDVVVSAGGTVGIGTDTVGVTGYALEVRGNVYFHNGGSGSDGLNMNNGGITGVNKITIADPGPNEGIIWGGGNGWAIYESPNDLTTNSAGNLQFVDGTSRILTLDTSGNAEFTGHITVDGAPTLENGGNTELRVTTDHGYVNIGPKNTSYSHFETDRTRFYFNRKIIVDEGIIASYDEDLVLSTNTSVERLRIDNSNGYVGINTASPSYQLHVNGSFAATTKSFVIDHPTKDGMKLRYGSLEGPENGVYVRGRLKGNNTIELPEHWTGLVDEETITVNLTPIGRKAPLHSVVDIADNTVIVESANDVVDCFYTVFGERKDVEKLEVEF